MYQQPESQQVTAQDNNCPNPEEELLNAYAHSDGYDSSGGEHTDRPTEVLREQDRFLPIANISRIMKKSIPSTGKIAKDAKECVQECVSEFVSFITSEASDRCKQEKRKTINGEDILFAMATLGFDNYIEPLKLYLMKYRDYTMRNEKTCGSGSGNCVGTSGDLKSFESLSKVYDVSSDDSYADGTEIPFEDNSIN